jgi:hypothetical protein
MSKTVEDYIEKNPVKQVSNQGDGRDLKTGQFKPGHSGNPNGRPPAGETIVDKFRAHPKGDDVINNIIEIAATLGSGKDHRDALSCAKLVIDRLVPSLKSSTIEVSTEDKGYVVLPPQSAPPMEDE